MDTNWTVKVANWSQLVVAQSEGQLPVLMHTKEELLDNMELDENEVQF